MPSKGANLPSMSDTFSKSAPESPPTDSSNHGYHPLGARRFGRFNWLGLWTLYRKEVQRFVKIWLQTLMSPIINALLFLAIFALALGKLRPEIGGIPYAVFLAPGLIMMAMVQNAFANTSSALLTAKVQGNVVDFLMPPLSAGELTFGMIMGGLTRGLFVGAGSLLAMWLFLDIAVHKPWVALFYASIASILMAQVGLLTGIWAEKFDHLATISNFVITPLAFLSGTFYSVQQLPPIAYTITQYNPFFYMIDGFRYALTGHVEGAPLGGGIFLVALAAVLWALCHFVLVRGYRLKP